jgi:uncharacterized protein (TIGR02246 family)
MRASAAIVLAACLLVTALPAGAADPPAHAMQRMLDRIEIQELVARYVTALDTRDPDLYENVFTEDAVFEVSGRVHRGRKEIRQIIIGLQKGIEERKAKGEPVNDLYHTFTNTSIEFVSDVEAIHHAYYQTIRVGPDKKVAIGTIGRYDDVMVKQNGRWYIRTRKAVNFTR